MIADTTAATERARLLGVVVALEGLLAQQDCALTDELGPRYEQATAALQALAEAEGRGETVSWADASPALLGLLGYVGDAMERTRELLATGLAHAEAVGALAQALDPDSETRGGALLTERAARLPVQ